MLGDDRHLGHRPPQAQKHGAGIDEFDVLVREVERRLHVGEQVEQVFAQRPHRLRHAARQLRQRVLQLGAVGRLDDGVDGLGPRQVELARQEGALGELARPRRPATRPQEGGYQRLHERRTTHEVQFGHVFAGVALRRVPEVQRRREGRMDPRQDQRPSQETIRRRGHILRRAEDRADGGSGIGAADAHDGPWARPRRRRQRDDGVPDHVRAARRNIPGTTSNAPNPTKKAM